MLLQSLLSDSVFEMIAMSMNAQNQSHDKHIRALLLIISNVMQNDNLSVVRTMWSICNDSCVIV